MVPNAACPQCDSHSRHRALFFWLRDDYQIANRAGVAFVFAPEKALFPLWQTARHLDVYKIDLEALRGVDVQADLMQLPFAGETADLIWCHHVLEQTPDDRIALSELNRVCSRSGELIVSVGVGNQEVTQEFGFLDKRRSGNRRLFGNDFVERLAEAGFKPELLMYDLTESERQTYAVLPERFYRCTKD
jgi:SAM-dependent methyltransferase